MEFNRLIPLAGTRLKYLVKISQVIIDDVIFRLHYRFTLVMLLGCSLLVACTQMFGPPIKCIKGGDVPEKMLDTFCWIEGTFTLPKALIKVLNTQVAAPGVEQHYEKDEVLGHAYYQWVCIVLFLQGICFYATRKLWKGWEGEKMKHIILELNKAILTDDKRKENQDRLVEYLFTRRGKHDAYAFRYFLCEVLNFLHVIVQMIFVNWFLGGEFSAYGLDAVRFVDIETDRRPDPMAKIFPKLTKCTFRRFGPSGDLMIFDNLCLMPLNILNEKIYIFIWFWFYILVIVSGMKVLYQIVVIAFPQSRYYLFTKFHHLIQDAEMSTILSRCTYGDWFLLFLLGKNLDTMHYRDVIKFFNEKLKKLPDTEDAVDSGKQDENVKKL